MSMIKIDPHKDALVVVDLQNDFCPGGALAVPDGDRVIPVINGLAPHFKKLFYTQDWHPPDHISFDSQGGIWPSHCVADTPGAQLHPGLRLDFGYAVQIKKGTAPDKEAYSGFQGTNLAEQLRKADVRRLIVTGLATDYCVKNTVLDALKAGFKVVVVEDAIRGVNVNPGDSARAIEEMAASGARISRFADII
jgi:nicotinamidase/pyrazinamidase